MYFGYCPTKKIYGEGAARHLVRELGTGERVAVVASASAVGSTTVCEDLGALWHGACVQRVFSGLGEPSYGQAYELAQQLRLAQATMVIAVGGGAIIDLTKAAALLTTMEGDADAQWAGLLASPLAPPALPVVSVLTVPGTSSDCNAAFVVDGPDGYKRAFSKISSFPRVAVLDGRYALSLRREQVQLGLFDASMHIFEQCMRPDAVSSANDALCASALAILIDVQRTMAGEGFTQAAADQMMRACSFILDGATLGRGVAVDSVTHELAGYLSSHFGLAHGATLAAVVPHYLQSDVGAGRRTRIQQIFSMALALLDAQGKATEESPRDMHAWLTALALDTVRPQSHGGTHSERELVRFVETRDAFLSARGVSVQCAQTVLLCAVESLLA